MVLIGNKIELKPVQPQDYELVAEWMSDPNYLGNFYNVTPETSQSIQHMIEFLSKSGETFLIKDRETKKPLGMIGYWNPFSMTPTFSGLEIWYQVHQDHRGQGLATQAASLLINHLFNVARPPVNRIQATVVVGNTASCRVLEKSGTAKDGVIRGVFFLHGSYHDMYLYSIIRSDWVSNLAYHQKHSF